MSIFPRLCAWQLSSGQGSWGPRHGSSSPRAASASMSHGQYFARSSGFQLNDLCLDQKYLTKQVSELRQLGFISESPFPCL